LSFLFCHSVYLRDLHSFPTRRSSDLISGSTSSLSLEQERIVALIKSRVKTIQEKCVMRDFCVFMFFNLNPINNSGATFRSVVLRSDEHTSELQSRENLVCRLLLEKKK